MSSWRSEEMLQGTIVVPADGAKLIVESLGLDLHVSFDDMNAHSTNRPYRRYIQRLDEMERILRVLTDEIQKLPGVEYECKQYVKFLHETSHDYKLDAVEERLKSLHASFTSFRKNNQAILDEKVATVERRAVTLVAARSIGMSQAFVEGGIGFSAISGVICQEDIEKFSRTVHRATRGNAFTHFEPLDEQATEVEHVSKSVFIVFFQGSTESVVYTKVSRLVSAFNATEYPWPRSRADAEDQAAELLQTIADKSKALQAFEDFFLQEISLLLDPVKSGANSLLGEWQLFCLKEKAVYAILDRFEDRGDTLSCDVWFPAYDDDRLRSHLLGFKNQDGPGAFLLVDAVRRGTAPTFFRNTGFTLGFQNFVNTYGVPRYRELNPAVITSITLPFLFGIMYGDIGHGLFILAFGVYLVIAQETLKLSENEVVKMMYGGRYMILLMGMFATYSGCIYNDFFSLGLDFFGTRYHFAEAVRGGKARWEPIADASFPYPFGFDPVWKGAENEMVMMNSFKMKFSVIIAGLHMGMGILFKAANALNSRDHLTFLFEFLPQIIFFFCFVGYMDLIIFYKWIVPGSAPNLITTIIEMGMGKPPSVVLFQGQHFVQIILLLVMLICLPLMLLPKPLLLNRFHKQKNLVRQTAIAAGTEDKSLLEEDEFDFGEEMIHQVIETIEFALGAISNTASYLRLWALSLAHQQLSVVFFEQSIMRVLNLTDMSLFSQTIALFIAFTVFASTTGGIMLGMDSLECYLHALRLQWVEFQSKFYKGDGIEFMPFDILALLDGTVEQQAS